MQVQPQSITCQLCGIKILSKCFEIHRRACEKNRHKTVKKLTVKGMPTEIIPCAECGQNIAFNNFSEHIEECVGRQLSKCPQCKILYPTFLIEQHLNVCTNFAEEQQQQYHHPVQKYNSQSEQQSENEEDNEMDELIMALAQNMQNEDEPLTVNMIELLKKNMVNKSEDCSICCCMVHSGTQIIKIPCNHIFHTRCITAWLQKNPHCPMCRRYVLT